MARVRDLPLSHLRRARPRRRPPAVARVRDLAPSRLRGARPRRRSPVVTRARGVKPSGVTTNTLFHRPSDSSLPCVRRNEHLYLTWRVSPHDMSVTLAKDTHTSMLYYSGECQIPTVWDLENSSKMSRTVISAADAKTQKIWDLTDSGTVSRTVQRRMPNPQIFGI